MPKGGENNGSEDELLFERAMRDVERLPEGPTTLPRKPRRRRRRLPGEAGPGRFEVNRWGEWHEGRTSAVGERRMAELRGGGIPVELRVDLHGFDEAQARDAVRGALARAVAGRLQCLLIIHGRGARSPDGPVLKAALPGWLAEPPDGSRVLGFTSAPRDLGGPGATLVLLRRRRGRGGKGAAPAGPK